MIILKDAGGGIGRLVWGSWSNIWCWDGLRKYSSSSRGGIGSKI